MNTQEQRLIEDLFARLRSVSGAEKDVDAERLIEDLIARFPDAPYYLTQSVLVQQQALEDANAQIKDLQERAEATRSSSQRGASSFLGGSSVPPSGPQGGRANAGAPSEPDRPSASPWRSSPSPAPARSGGFLASALTTATGVAGGMFLADSIKNLFGGGSESGSAVAAEKQSALDKAQDDAQDAEDNAAQAQKDLAADDAALDDDQDYGWGDDDGGLDI